MRTRVILWASLVAVVAPALFADTYIVAPSGGDYTLIQDALDVAVAGDLILVRDKSGGYAETIRFPRSGSASQGPIVLRADDGHQPILDGTTASGQHMVLLEDVSYIEMQGFEIRNHLGVNDGSGIRVQGEGTQLALRDNVIHDIRGSDAMGITVYGTSTSQSISDLIIDGNTIYDCEPARSEALTLNGNVERFEVTNNVVRDVNNIGIDFIGGETDINPSFVVRDGVCRGNVVERARSSYGGGYAAGIYVDGARDILIEGNIVRECDLGIEVGAENAGWDATGICVRGNLIVRNDKVGIVFGGYDQSVGRVRDCEFVQNTCFGNDTTGQFLGELWIQYASNNDLRGNLFYATDQNILMYSEGGNVSNTLDYNLWFCEDGSNAGEWVWQGVSYGSFNAYQSGSGQGAHSLFADPSFRDAAADDFRLQSGSAAVDAADPQLHLSGFGLQGIPRLLDGDLDRTRLLDHGAYEFSHVDLTVTGDVSPGGSVSLDLIGTAGLPVFLWAGFPDEVLMKPFGPLAVDLTLPWLLLPYGALPSQGSGTIPVDADGLLLAVQALAVGGEGGNLSNVVMLDLR